MKWVTVNDMYKCSKGSDFPLLSEFNGDFWTEYLTNYTRYDKLFNRMFMSFRYFMQEPVSMCEDMTDEHVEEVTRDFSYEVYSHLLVNSKKYSELYRVNVVNDETFSIVDNYNVTETLERETTKSDNDTYGQRVDNETETKGAKTDVTSETLGAKTDTNSTTIGSRTDTNETVNGQQTNIGTNTIAGFNSTGFENDNKVTDNLGARTDNSETIIGQQTNTSNSTSGQQINETEIEYGQQSNTRGLVKGSQSDTHTGLRTEEYTLIRKGNIGIKTATAVMAEHAELWSKWEFYSYIFKEICSDLLLI